VINQDKIGTLMKLESIIKRYPSGESDIIVKCYDIITLETLHRTYKDRMYPGGEVNFWNVPVDEPAENQLMEVFQRFLDQKKSKRSVEPYGIHAIAQELNLDYGDRYTYLTSDDRERVKFLVRRIKYLIEILKQEEKSKDVFHLN
jgi:hypothetical protein